MRYTVISIKIHIRMVIQKKKPSVFLMVHIMANFFLIIQDTEPLIWPNFLFSGAFYFLIAGTMKKGIDSAPFGTGMLTHKVSQHCS